MRGLVSDAEDDERLLNLSESAGRLSQVGSHEDAGADGRLGAKRAGSKREFDWICELEEASESVERLLQVELERARRAGEMC
jgi:hypothetical protein